MKQWYEEVFENSGKKYDQDLKEWYDRQFEDYYLLSFWIVDPEKPVARFKKLFPGQEYTTDTAKDEV